MLTVRGLVVEVGGKRIVEGASLQVRPGEKVGLVGRNGAGKTTLLRVLGGADRPRSGLVERAALTGYLSQDPRSDAVPDDTSVLSHVFSGRGLDDLLARTEKLRIALDENPSTENIQRFSDAQEAFEAAGGYAAEAEVRKLADGVGLRPDRLDLHLGALSGGERRRAELVRILFGGSDLLLLDEPTNHLDADARNWLLKFLRSYRGALLVVSHDLDLLDEAITRVVHIDRESEEGTGTLVEYKGTYSQYLAAREGNEERAAKLSERQSREIARLKVQAGGMRGQTAKRARVAKNLDQRRAKLEAAKVQNTGKRRALAVRFPEPPSAGRTVLTATELYKSFGSLDVFGDVSFDVGRGERLLVMGLNGAGKTTLLKVLADQLSPDLGEVELGTHVSVGYYAQEHEGIVPGRTLLEHMREASPAGDGALRNLLGMFGLSGQKVFQDADTLSGGEKTKLALTQLVAGRHNVLLLDEPTNNLDPASRTATGEALAAWPGTMIVVSHDVEFVRSLAPDRALLMPDGTLDYFDDEMLDLLELV
ncbi:MAG TPA: ABC-F family ATP-binding cassette domain-containing protein [Acidimicrobiia bacterium]|nr:ABC-F family ATP-binding cassette domain-containing protein [Acidimicrobiia bacterium]